MMMTIRPPDYTSRAWEGLTIEMRSEVRGWLDAFRDRPAKGITQWLRQVGEAMGSNFATAKTKYYALKDSDDWTVLIDHRKLASGTVAADGTASPLFRGALITLVEDYGRNNSAAFRELKRRWLQRRLAIPGYEEWPDWPKIPSGWHKRNLSRIVKHETNKARLTSIRVGTSSKTNPFLPIVHTTRVGLWPGAVIQFDDQWHDDFVTLGRKRELVRVIELGALDLFSGHRFHWGAKPRRTGSDGRAENIRKRDMLLFGAGMLHRFGTSSRGSMWMVEHGTASVSEAMEQMLYDATGGMIRVERQPIEGKQAALCGYWSGSEGGNFRAKACLESTHNLIRNDGAARPLQLGSYSSGIKGTVTTDRQVRYIKRVVADLFKNVPHREAMLKLPTWDFHTQLIPWLTDYYQFGLAMRTDHELEGWERLQHVVTEYTTLPGSDHWLSEADFLALPEESQSIIGRAVLANPKQWSQRRNLSPLEVWNRRSDFRPVPVSLICEILQHDAAREVTIRNGFAEFSDLELTPDELIYTAKFISGPRARQLIPSGEKVLLFANPYDDTTAFVVDAKGIYQGELPLYKRVLPIDPAAFHTDQPFESRPAIRSQALTRAAGEKHSRIAEILEPTRINQRERVQEARAMRDHNQRVLSRAPITPEELHQAASASGLKGARTAAANRLQEHGEARDWETYQPEQETQSAWDALPEDAELPAAF